MRRLIDWHHAARRLPGVAAGSHPDFHCACRRGRTAAFLATAAMRADAARFTAAAGSAR